MNEDKFDKLIDGLADDLKPMKRMGCAIRRALPYLIFSVIYLGALVHFVGIRGDIDEKITDTAFLLENTLMGLALISAAFCSSFLCVPDMRGQKWLIALPITSVSIFALWSIIRAWSEGLHMPHLHIDHCMGEGLFMASIPLSMVVFMMRTGATTQPRLSALMNVIYAGGLAYVGLRLTCSMDTVGHATVSHLIPYLIIGAILGLSARKLYKW